MSDLNSRLVRVYSSTSSTEAHLVRNVLEENGLQASVSGDLLAHVGLGNAGAVEVYTFEQDASAAREIIEHWHTSDDHDSTDVDSWSEEEGSLGDDRDKD